MSIRRGHVPATDGFTIVPNIWARDDTLTFRARGLLTYLLSHREGWELTGVRELARRTREGRDAIQGALEELEVAGYLTRSRQRDEGTGRLGPIDYVVGDDPFDAAGGSAAKTDTPKTHRRRSAPETHKPVPGEPVTGKPTTKKNIPPLPSEEEGENTTPPRPARTLKATPAFEAFYKIHPRTTGRRAALNVWDAHGCEDIADEVIAGARRYAADPNRIEQFTKTAPNWLADGGWDASPEPPRHNQSFAAQDDAHHDAMFAATAARFAGFRSLQALEGTSQAPALESAPWENLGGAS